MLIYDTNFIYADENVITAELNKFGRHFRNILIASYNNKPKILLIGRNYEHPAKIITNIINGEKYELKVINIIKDLINMQKEDNRVEHSYLSLVLYAIMFALSYKYEIKVNILDRFYFHFGEMYKVRVNNLIDLEEYFNYIKLDKRINESIHDNVVHKYIVFDVYEIIYGKSNLEGKIIFIEYGYVDNES